MRRRVLLLVIACAVQAAVVLAGPAEPAHRMPGPGPTSQSATQPTGHWYCWSDCRFATLVGQGDQCLWFAGLGLLWRYDLKTQTIESFTPMDGLPLEWCAVSAVAVAGNGAYAVRFQGIGGVYLGRMKQPWRALAPPEQGWRFAAIAFDAAGRLHCVVGPPAREEAIYCWDAGTWAKVRDVPRCRHMVLLDKGYFLAGVGADGAGAPVFAPAGGGPARPYELGKGLMFHRSFVAGGRALGLFQAPDGRRIFYRIAPERLVKEHESNGPEGPLAGLDLAGGGYLKLAKPTQAGRAPGEDDVVAAGVELRSRSASGLDFAVRDANKHVWCGLNRWDGKAWKLIAPLNHLPEFALALDRRRFTFDPSTLTWRRVDQHVAPELRATFDPASGLAWRLAREGAQDLWQHVRVGPPAGIHRGGAPLTEKGTQVLRAVPAPDYFGGPEFQDSAGQWWWIGMPRWSDRQRPVAIRLDQDGRVHTYPAQQHEAGWPPQVIRSPAGIAWLWDRGGYSRYDARQARFVPAEPYQEFSFQVGRWRLAMTYRSYPAGRKLFAKKNGTWGPMVSPLGPGEVGGNCHMVFGDRMLLVIPGVGVAEYDATGDRWALLHDHDNLMAGFDAGGRRILVFGCCMLMYDGDPFRPEGSQGDGLLNGLLRLMDDDSWRIRDEATGKLRELYPRMRHTLEAALQRKDLSAEVRTRIAHVLGQAKDAERSGPIGLFHRMHPSAPACRGRLEEP